MKALLIIDMQVGGFKAGLPPRYDVDGVINRINLLAEKFRANGDKVICIQHDGTKQDEFIPGTQDWQLLPSLNHTETDIVISKTANDAFYRSALQDTLTTLNIKELVITGWATDFCVDTTIRSAFNKDYHIVVIQDAHTVGERPYLSAEKVIEHHNAIWQGMTPTNGSITVLPFDEWMKQAGS